MAKSVTYPYEVGSIVNCGKRSFVIKDWTPRLRVYYSGATEDYYEPKLSKPIIDGIVQKGGHAHDCEKELIVKGLARLESIVSK